jgi:4-diphosphocytidyl-2-C-methyl-D-erythritol kinase
LTEVGTVWWPAPAKLNLFLHVTGRREDGYHDIQTLFQLIDWCDELRVDIDQSGRISRTVGDYGVPEEKDLMVRAARLLREEAGIHAGAALGIRKRIPVGAGLGGGSSDAATVLLALNRIWRCGLTVAELAGLGRRLGADVPLFVHGRSALAEGVGDRLRPVALGDRHYVLVLSPIAVSTASAFADPDLERDAPLLGLADALSGAGRNVFQPIMARRHPDLGDTLRELRRWGEPRLTGTGSCIFLSMPDEGAAKRTAQDLKCRYNVRAVRGLDWSPVVEISNRR